MNLTALQSAIQAKGYGTDTVAQQTQFINEVYREVCGMQRWPFLEKQDASLVTVNGAPSYTLPMADWRSLDAVRLELVAGQIYINMRYMEPQDFREFAHIDRDVSTPIYWTWMNGQLALYPIPDNTYTVRIDYIMEPPDLVAGTDVPVLPIPYHDILVWGAVESLAYRERDWLGRQFAQGKKEMLLARMDKEYMVRQRQSGTHVKKSGYWDVQLPYPFLQDGV